MNAVGYSGCPVETGADSRINPGYVRDPIPAFERGMSKRRSRDRSL